MLQTRAESARWWRSPRVADALHLTAEQVEEIDRLYAPTLPARCRASQAIAAIERHVEAMNDNDASDEELLKETERLTRAFTDAARMRRAWDAAILAILTRDQRLAFVRLRATKAIE